jgi:hypothetical protein
MVNGECALNLKITTLSRFQHIVIVAALIAPLLSFVSAPTQAAAPTCAEGGVCQVGDIGPGGGIVFYVASTTFTQIGASGSMCTTNCKYLEAAPTSGTNAWTGTNYQWSGVLETAIGTTGTAIGTGYSNTVKMVTQSATADRAGTISRAYRGPNNLTDWFLPSYDELNELYVRRASVGGFVGDFHWSSSELSSIDPNDEPEKKAWFQSFAAADRPMSPNIKFSTLYVRPIRAFGPLTCAQGGVCQLGDMGPGGGIVFYVSPSANGFISAATQCAPTSRCKYLEAAPITGTSAWTDSIHPWSSGYQLHTGVIDTSIGGGYANTSTIITLEGGRTDSAAYVSRAYRGPNTLSDWYLPSKDELGQLYAERVRVGVRYSAQGDNYWTSSEFPDPGVPAASYPHYLMMNFPFWTSNPKSDSLYVRPIRAFGSAPAEIISVAAIGGVTAPVVGATPVTTVTSANGYTGTVTWSGSPTTFAGVTAYTATITLTAAAGYTLTGVSANFFTVAGTSASATNPINSGEITAAFPATAVGPATKALMTTQPSGAVSGAAFTTQPVVRVTDVDGNTNTSFTGNVVASIASGTGTLGGTTTVAAVSGVATFTDLGILGLGNFTLRFTPASLTAVDSSSFALEAAPVATKVAITRAAVGTQRRTAFTTQPQITIQYANNDTVTASSAVVTATISSGGTLIGTTTATASSGVATFSNLGVDGTIGSTYTITYTAVDLTVATATVTLIGTTCDGATFTCQVGDTGPGGGKIFYVAPTTFTQLGATGFMCSTACKYLEAAPTSGTGAWTDEFYRWSGNIDTLIGTTGTAIGTGYKNTLAIVAQSNTSDRAATVSRGYSGPNSLRDWFLPSKDELNELYMQKAFVGSFQENYYWSSSESDATRSFDQNFLGGSQGTTLKNGEDYVRPIRAFGTAPTSISVFAIGGVTAPVSGATPVSTVTAANGYTGTVTWSGSPTTFASSTIYTATITLTAAAGYTLAGVGANSYTVAGATSVTHSADSGIVTAAFPATAAPTAAPVVAVAPTPVPYLKTLTTPKLRLSTGKLLCTPGTYNAGYTLDGVVQGSTTTLFTPSSFTYNLLINGISQTSLAVTSSSTSHSWTMPASTSGALITCSVTVTANGITNTDKSGDNTSGASSALTTQSAAIATANATYSAALSANTKAYQKALVDNRTQWRSTTEKIRTDYYAERNRINSLPSTKATRALSSAALKAYTAAVKKSAADYKASGPAALEAKKSADQAALEARNLAIAKANAIYGTFIESIGYGVLIP